MSSEVAGAMSEEHRSALVPRLRFPAFRDGGDWVTPKLEDISVPVEERVGDRKLIPISISAGIGFVPQTEKFGRDISGNQYRLYTVVRDGDFVYNKGNSLKFPQGCVYDLQGWGEVAAPNVFICFRLKDGYENGFFRQCFEKNAHGLQLRKHITSGARSNGLLNISRETFFNIKIPTPKHEEQQKIADCLSSLDELIAAETQKLVALKTHKKGLMQQLFPREGETVPQLRFPEFLEAGEWEEKQIGDLQPFVTSGSRGWAAYYANQGSLFVRITNLTRGSIYLDLANTKFVKLPQEASEGVRTQLKEFDLLISITADIGIIGYVDASVPSPAYINQHIALVRFDTSQVCSQYVSYFLASERSQRHFHASTDVGTKAGMNLLAVQQIQLVLPTLPEQQKIAAFLSSLDNLIADQNLTVNALKTHKNGLMQQLFPVQEEVQA